MADNTDRQDTTLRPGLLVSIKTSVTGNVKYAKLTIEPDHATDNGERRAKWETERTIADAAEHTAALRTRGGARSRIAGVCAATAFGYLCPEDKAADLAAAIAGAMADVAAFNRSAALTRVSLYVISGRIAQNDREAIRAINSEVSDLLRDMEAGVKDLDAEAVRAAAAKAKAIGEMMSEDAAALIRDSVEVARAAARKIAKAEKDGTAASVDTVATTVINAARGRFLDVEDAGPVAAPAAARRELEVEEEGA